MTDRDLFWLTAERPDPIALDEATTERARDALLRHAAEATATGLRRPRFAALGGGAERSRQRRAAGLGGASSARLPTHRLATWPRRLLRVGASAVVAGGVATAVLLVPSGGDGNDGGAASHLGIGVQPAAAAQLRKLSDHIRTVPQPPGDATLVLRTTTFPRGHRSPSHISRQTGADLYIDDGAVYDAPTRAALAARVAGHEPVGDGFARRDMAAAAAAFDGTAAQARERMAKAERYPSLSADVRLIQARAIQAQVAAARKPLHALGAGPVEDYLVWANAVNALNAGAGRPDVRAGVMHLLATIPSITVTRTTAGGRPALDIRSGTFADDYQQDLVVDAATGVPLRSVGGRAGQAPDVTTTYDVTRVTAATLRPAG